MARQNREGIKKKGEEKENDETITSKYRNQYLKTKKKQSCFKAKIRRFVCQIRFCSRKRSNFEDDLKDEQKGEFPSKWIWWKEMPRLPNKRRKGTRDSWFFIYNSLFRDKDSKYLPTNSH
jgi:hypothetical protein